VSLSELKKDGTCTVTARVWKQNVMNFCTDRWWQCSTICA